MYQIRRLKPQNAFYVGIVCGLCIACLLWEFMYNIYMYNKQEISPLPATLGPFVRINNNIALIIPGKCDIDTPYYLQRSLYNHIQYTSMIPSQIIFSISHLNK